MKMHKLFSFLLFIFCCVLQLPAQITTINTQVLVVGGSTGGTAAGIQSARSGAETFIVEQTNILGVWLMQVVSAA